MFTGFARVFPYVGLPIYVFLYLRDGPSARPIPWLLAKSYRLAIVAMWIPGAIALLYNLSPGPLGGRVLYWSAEPTWYYLSEAFEDIHAASIGRALIGKEESPMPYAPSTGGVKQIRSSLGLMIVLVRDFARAANGPEAKRTERMQDFFKSVTNLAEASDEIKPVEQRFNPLFYFFAGGAMTIQIMSAINQYMKIDYERKIVRLLNTQLDKSNLPPAEIEVYRRRLASTDFYKDEAAIHGTYLADFLKDEGRDSLASVGEKGAPAR